MAVGGQEALHVFQPDPRADPGDQIVQPPRIAAAGAADLFGRQGGDLHRLQPDLINAETGLHLCDAALKQRQDTGRVAHRAGQAQFDLLGIAVDPAQRQAQDPRPGLLRAELVTKPGQQPIRRRHHVAFQPDGVRQGHADTVMRRLGLGADLLGLMPQRLVQPQQQARPETARQRGARGAGQLTDTTQPHALQPGDGFGIQPQRLDRQIGQCRVRAVMRPRPGRPARIAQPRPHRQPGTGQPLAHRRQHRLFPAEQMRRSGDVQHQPVRAVARDPGTPPQRPAAQGGQELRVQIGPRRAADQIGAKGARVGKAHPAIKPLPPRRHVQAMDPVGIAVLQRQDKGPISRACPQRPVCRQPGEPQRHDPPLHPIEHAKIQVFLICS